ncbi:olfactory receptor 52D1-like [Rhinophrynus dorsalis]
MPNSTHLQPSVLTLGFGEMTPVRYFYCVFVLVCFLFIVLANSAVIIVVVLHKTLHEPMYIFVCVLCVNGLYGSTAFFPSLFVNLFYQTQTVSYIGCLTQVFCIHTYGGCEMSILAVMAFDRYVCICNPLRYNTIMSLSTVFKLIAGAWLYSIILVTTNVILTIRLPLCDSVILKIYCDNWSVVRLSCIDTTVNNIFGLVITASFIGVMPAFIFYSYVEILRVCASSSREFRAKALQTCAPHLITISNFIVDVLFEVLLYRFSPKNLPYELRVVMSLQFLVVPPILNPLIYGLNLKEIRLKVAHMICQKNTITVQGPHAGASNSKRVIMD